MIKTLLKQTKGYRLLSLLSPLLIIVEVYMEVQIPFVMADMVNNGILAGAGIEYILKEGGKMVVMALISLLAGAGAARFAAQAGMGVGANVRAAIFARIQNFSFANIDRFSTPSLITRMTTDINTVQMGYTMIIRMFVRSPIMLVMAFSYAYRINADLSKVFAIAAPILLILLGTMGALALPRFKKLMKKYDGLNASIQETLIGARVVKAFVRARHEKDKFKLSNDELKDASIAAEKLLILSGPFMQMTIYGCIISILWFGSNLVIGGTMQIADLTAFITYVNNILMSLMMISMIFVMVIMSRASINRVAEVINEVPDINDDNADPTLTVANGDIDMENVCFKYKKTGKKNVIDNINLHIKSGETVGIIGGTGSAKTTLVQMIPRLYDVTEGVVKVGGRPVGDYTLKNLRDSVAMVLQVNLLFSGTIEENLRWGNADASMEEIEKACKIAQAHDFITSFPDGYQTYLGQGGVNLSGGQKQRLCIARALLKSPKVLILDDSTSAVDTATDAKIREGFKANHGDVTTIIVAQRISSIQHADKIIVLDDGKINAIGSHDELLGTNEIYSEVYKSQQEGDAE
ncbi:MAG: ABC transporter ATP-binding protein [Clostridia bacterium]|nr:ABC transporter ATP-binding protein [Clostridia bacterium]MBQ7120692.1 ABC transporter ATP-binding protein [Clostridia bacterium]